MHVVETYGTSHERSFFLDSDKNVQIEKSSTKWKSLANIFMVIFLPHGYPDSVSHDYLQYQVWDSIQAFSSSITGGLCTHAVLKGVGVGDETASPIAATITWLLKDGSSMVGRILFAWFQGTKLDCDSKKWRLFADIINDLSMLLDLISGYLQAYFLHIVCISGILKAAVGVAGGSTRAALTQHQARQNNMADVSAKDGSQETLVNLIALFCNLALIPLISDNYMLTWLLFIIMTFIHLMSNFLAVKSVIMETLNEERFKIFADHYFEIGMEKRQFLSVVKVNKEENILFFLPSAKISTKLGASFHDVIHCKSFEEIQHLLNIYWNCHYILNVSRNRSEGAISVVFNKKATVHTYMEALFQACYIEYLLKNKSSFYKGDIGIHSLEAESREFTRKMFKDYLNCLKTMHFNTDNALFDIDLWRAEW